jgi:hypothetical protein
MTKYYLSVLKDNVSICIDSDIGCHHRFKIGDVILVEYDIKFGSTLMFDGMSRHYSLTSSPEFVLDWDKTVSARLTVAGCIIKGVMVDITKQVGRDFKLKQLGI